MFVCDLPPAETVAQVRVLHHLAEQTTASFRDPAAPGRIHPQWISQVCWNVKLSGGNPQLVRDWAAREEERAMLAGEEPVLPRTEAPYVPKYTHAVDGFGRVHSSPVGVVSISGGALRITGYIDD